MPKINVKLMSILVGISLSYDVVAVKEFHGQGQLLTANIEIPVQFHKSLSDFLIKQENIDQSDRKVCLDITARSSAKSNNYEKVARDNGNRIVKNEMSSIQRPVISQTIEPKIDIAGFEVINKNTAPSVIPPTLLIIGSALIGMIIVARRKRDDGIEQN